MEKSDADDLLQVYSDKNALPFFNSDNCDGDNFYYHTKALKNKAIDFWLYSYKEEWFVRWAIVEKATGKAIGTIEMFKRLSEDAFNTSDILQPDIGSLMKKQINCLAQTMVLPLTATGFINKKEN